ncbi:MAG: galactokinase [Flavobacteriales bacterium]|nr:galactokinase [Flavobacteriales bacterium]
MKKQLISRVKLFFLKELNTEPLLISSPGRINLIGEHTDYNKGLVFPASIDKYIISGFAKNEKNYCRIFALDLDESFDIDLDKLTKVGLGSWKNYVIGVLWGIKEKGLPLRNFDLVFSGNIPIGAGISSSAAVENSIVFGLNELFDLGLTKDEMLHISVQAEHNFAGVKCGIMDQFTNLNGSKGNALFLNCNDMSFEEIPIVLNDYQLLLINTNVKHQLSASPFNLRKKECSSGYNVLKEKFPELVSLSGANLAQLEVVKDELPDITYNRCKFVIQENNRVKLAKTAIKNKDCNRLGNLLFESHFGLKELYEVSCEELDFLVDLARNNKVLGSRMMGGGFGGCTINLIKKDEVEVFVSNAAEKYQLKFGKSISAYPVNISGGIQLIQ